MLINIRIFYLIENSCLPRALQNLHRDKLRSHLGRETNKTTFLRPYYRYAFEIKARTEIAWHRSGRAVNPERNREQLIEHPIYSVFMIRARAASGFFRKDDS